MKNRIEVEGYLAAKPERRFLPSGSAVANGRLAETYMIHRTGEQEPESRTNWHALSFYGSNATAAAHLEKGDHLFVVGTYETREWTGEDGRKRTAWELSVSSFFVIAPRTEPSKQPSGAKQEATDAAWPA